MEVLMPIVMLGQKLATAIKTHLSVPRVAFLFTGGDIPHLHAHVVPMHEKTDITSRQYIVEDIVTFRDAPRMQRDALEAVAADLRRALADTA